ncbi:MAG TPA: prepilin-type N-terminal cleavage/methylation domain-containing protein [Acidimicrobiales bacterium]|nr:prepilin-type N-terminal cleavage/methylation domain-containing protein [Acidimicrobiales bacterium]
MTRHEDGFTAVEMVVTVAVMSIVTFMLLGFLDSSTKLTTRAALHTRAQQDSERALRVVTEDLRAANPITGAPCAGGYGDCVSFTVPSVTQTGRDCEKTVYTYVRSGTTLTRSLTENTWNGTGCSVTRQITNLPILTGLANASVSPAQPMFTYYDDKGVQLDPATQSGYIPRKPDQGGAAEVKLNLVVKFMTGVPELRLSSIATLRNNR